MSLHQTLLSRVRKVRREWRLQALVKGIAVLLAAASLLVLLGIWGADLFGFRTPAVWVARVLTIACAAAVIARFLYLPLKRRVSDVQVAQYIEERYPQLEDRLVAAVEYGRGTTASPGMLDLLMRDALQKIRHLNFRAFVDRRRMASQAAVAGGALAGLFLLLAWGPSFLRYGFDRIYAPWLQAAERSSFAIEVRPGNANLAQGSDQEFEANLVGFDSPEVRLLVQEEGKSAWEALPMAAERQGSRLLYLMLNIQNSLRYRVEAGAVRSPDYTIRVTGLGRVDRIDARYDFPAYAGMESQTVENEGDLSALKGTRVTLTVRLNKTAPAARLLLDDQSFVPLEAAGESAFTGALTVSRAGSYTVQVADAHGEFYSGSREYQIDAIDDAPPSVSITRPLRDVRATSVEEVFAEVSSEDDIGLGKVQLHFSVNGAPEKVISLYSGKPPEKATVSAHTFFIEEFGLQPGDIVSYYAQVEDNNNVSGPGTASSDIYFIQIRPFENKYRQNQQAAMPGGGGEGMGGGESLSRQQKDIIVATFKLIRDKETMDPKEHADGLNALALVQSRLQLQVQGVVDRLNRRGASDVNEDFANMTEYLKAGAEEMGKAAVQLGARQPGEALPFEQKALQQLLRAESLFLEIQISFANQQGGGSGGSVADAEDLADLFELELNKLKNQYETVQRGERQQRDQKTDEAMERLKELARRQQQLNERNRLLGQRGGSAGSSSGGAQQQLMDEAESLARQLQRLSRERNSPELSRVGSQLQQAIREMKQAMQNQQAGKDAVGQGIRALQRLEEAQRALSREQSTDLTQGLENALQESKGLVEEQRRIQEGIDRLAQEAAAKKDARQLAEDLSARKETLAERLRTLQGGIQDLARQARRTQPETSSKLNDAAGTIRDRKLPERILSGGRMLQSGYLEALQGREEFIRAGLEELNRRLEEAKNSVGQTREGKLADALDKTRQLADGLESMQQRLRQGQEGNPDETSRGQTGRTGREAQPGETRGAQGMTNPGTPQPARPAGQDLRAQPGGSSRTQAGAGAYEDEDFRQLSREWRQRLADAEELRRYLDRNSTQMQNLNDVIEKLRALDASRSYADPHEVALLKEAVDLLHRIEADLSTDLARLTQKDKFLYADDNDAPAAYRRLVEEYYKALARVRK